MSLINPTLDSLSVYVKFFLHPFHSHRELANGREQERDFVQVNSPRIVDFISISWIFMMVKAMYAFAFLYIGKVSSDYLAEKESITALLGSEPSQIHRFIILFTLFEVILFPVALWFYTKFWGLIIKFFCNLFDNDPEKKEEIVEEVVATSLTSNMFLLVPIFGNLGKHISSLFYLYAGLRENLKFSKVQSIVVLLGPVLLLLLFIFVIFIYFFLLFSMI